MSYSYLIKSPKHLVQLLACNLLPKGYVFYSSAWIPEDKDPVLVDAKLTLTYQTHLAKHTAYRRRKAGHATVRYFRCGRLALLVATRGTSPFFDREPWKDARDNPLHLAGYSVGVNKQSGKVSIRLHREAQRRLKREFTERAAWSLEWWERWMRGFPFLPFAGVRDGQFALLRHLNACRKSLRLPPLDWHEVVRKKFTPEPVFLDSPPELLELLRHAK